MNSFRKTSIIPAASLHRNVSMSLDYNGRTGIWANTDIRPLSVNFGVNIKNYDSSYAKSITIVSQTFAAPVTRNFAAFP